MIYWQTRDDVLRGGKNHVTIGTHKDGSVHVNINVKPDAEPDGHITRVWVTAHLYSPEMQVALEDTMEALKHYFPLAVFGLDLPYLPYGRQDRRCNTGEALQLKRFAGMINRQGFDQVQIFDPHSDVALNLIDNSTAVTQEELFGELHDFRDWVIVAPDLGAMKKVEKFAKAVQAHGMITFHKSRNLQTMEILRHDLLNPQGIILGNWSKVLVLDDLCDGGRTFVGVASELMKYEPKQMELAVTHGIFSYGQEVVTDVYDKVHTTNSFHPLLTSSNKINVIKV